MEIKIIIDDRIVRFFGRVFTRRRLAVGLSLAVLVGGGYVYAIDDAPPHQFQANTSISSQEVNTNFNQLYAAVHALENGGVGTAALADNAVTTDKLQNSTSSSTGVTTPKIANGAVTTDKLQNSTSSSTGVTTPKIANGAVTTAKLQDSTNSTTGVTAAKLATGAVTTAKLASNAVTTDKIGKILPSVRDKKTNVLATNGNTIDTFAATSEYDLCVLSRVSTVGSAGCQVTFEPAAGVQVESWRLRSSSASGAGNTAVCEMMCFSW